MPRLAACLVLLLALAGRAPAAPPPGAAEVLRVADPAGLDAAEQALLASLQGLANRRTAAVWIKGGGFARLIPEELAEEGVAVVPAGGLDDLLAAHRDAFEGLVLCDVADASLNVATALAGVRRGLVVDASLEARLRPLKLPVLADVRGLDEDAAFRRF
jgi:hypothetical protein